MSAGILEAWIPNKRAEILFRHAVKPQLITRDINDLAPKLRLMSNVSFLKGYTTAKAQSLTW